MPRRTSPLSLTRSSGMLAGEVDVLDVAIEYLLHLLLHVPDDETLGQIFEIAGCLLDDVVDRCDVSDSLNHPVWLTETYL